MGIGGNAKGWKCKDVYQTYTRKHQHPLHRPELSGRFLRVSSVASLYLRVGGFRGGRGADGCRGATRPPPSPQLSEAQSYLSLANALELLPSTPIPEVNGHMPLPLNLRVATEEYAMDSYENLLFAIARFHEVTGRWPERITVVGYGMKQKR